ANHAMLGKTWAPQSDLAHRVERIRNNDENGIRRTLDAFIDNFADNVRVRFQQVIAAHSRFARQAGSDDYHIRVGGFFVTISASQAHIEPLDRRSFRQIERFALRYALDDIDQDYVAEFFRGEPVRRGRADVAGAHNCNFLSCMHDCDPFTWRRLQSVTSVT